MDGNIKKKIRHITIDKEVFNDAYIPYLENKDRNLIIYGGAGSGKSYFIVQRYVYKIIKEKTCNLIVVRAYANLNKTSTFALFKQVINLWGLAHLFIISKTDLSIRCRVNDNEIVFKGLDDREKIKSITFPSGEATDIWVEEATEISYEDYKQLQIRLRGGKSSKQMLLSFNPINATHWIKREVIDKNKASVLKTTYKDNKFLNEDDIKTLEDFKESDLYYYDVYCLGRWGVTGSTIFSPKAINDRLDNLKEPVKVGYFIYEYIEEKIKNISFIEDEKGYIKIYKDKKEGHPYVIGGDTSGEGSDYFIGQVLDNTTGEQVATLRHQFDEDLYTHQMYCLGMYFNEALIGIEANFSTYPIKELQRLGYFNQYVRTKIDSYTNNSLKAYGFKTTKNSRPVLIANLVGIVREEAHLINDKVTLEEMITFVRNEKGREEAENGCHDDTIIALGIAYMIREQQKFLPQGGGGNNNLKYEGFSSCDVEREVEVI